MNTFLMLLLCWVFCLVKALFIPDSLKFIEPLMIEPSQVLLISGGDSWERRFTGYSKLSARSLRAFSDHHRYRLVFLDQLDYDRTLIFEGVKYHPNWHRMFAFGCARAYYPQCKYFVWIDDDILAPYPETDMLNHYINDMEKNPDWQMLFGEEAAPFILNSGFFIFRDTDFVFDLFERVIKVGLEEYGRLARYFGHEQESFAIIRKREHLTVKLRVIPHRDRVYNFNTFERESNVDFAGMRARPGDAFVHFLGASPEARLEMMEYTIGQVEEWRKALSPNAKFPIQAI